MSKSKHDKIMTFLLRYHFLEEGSSRDDWNRIMKNGDKYNVLQRANSAIVLTEMLLLQLTKSYHSLKFYMTKKEANSIPGRYQ